MIVHSWIDQETIHYTFFSDRERIAELPTAFIKAKAFRLAKKSLEVYARRLRDYCHFLEYHHAYRIVEVDNALKNTSLMLIEDFLKQLNSRGLSSSTIRGYEITIREFCKWLSSNQSGNILKKDIYAGQTFLTKSPSTRLPALINAEKVINLIKCLNFEEHRLIAHFIYDTGLRISEVPRVLKSDIPNPMDFERDVMYFPLLVSGSKGKGNQFKERITIISRALINRINKYHNSKVYLKNYTKHKLRSRNNTDIDHPAFLNTQGNPLSIDAIENFLRDASFRANIKISSHLLRHGTAYSVLRSEYGQSMLDNLIIAQKVLGHADISTTEIYTRVPAAALVKGKKSDSDNPIFFRFEESQRIFEETFLKTNSHSRKRRQDNKN